MLIITPQEWIKPIVSKPVKTKLKLFKDTINQNSLQEPCNPRIKFLYGLFITKQKLRQFAVNIKNKLINISLDKFDIKTNKLLESITFEDKPKFTAEEIKVLAPQIKRLLNNPKTNEFTETLLKDINVDKLSSLIMCHNLSEDNVAIYRQLITEKMPDNSRRFNPIIIPYMADTLTSGDNCMKLLYNSLDSKGEKRLSGNDIFWIQQNINIQVAMKNRIPFIPMFGFPAIQRDTDLLSAIKDGSIFNPKFGFVKKIDEKMKTCLMSETQKVLKLRNADGNLLTGNQLSILLSLGTLNSRLNVEKLLKIKELEGLSYGMKKDLLYALEIVKQKSEEIIKKFKEQGLNIESLIPNLKKLDLDFIKVDDTGKIDTTNLSESFVNARKSLVKSRPLVDAEALNKFDKGMLHLEKILTSKGFDVAKIKEIKLDYPRADFINDMKKAIQGLTEGESREFTRTFGFEFVDDDLIKYPTIATSEEITQITNPKVRKAVEEFNVNVENFTMGNKISIQESPELEKALNGITSLIPEFLTTIGKIQHKTHDYTLDIHLLKTLQESLNDQRWTELNESDKKIAKIAILFHDIAKPAKKVEKLHPVVSAQDITAFLEKSGLSETERERAVGLVKNHHWLAQINQKKAKDKTEMLGLKLAFEFRKPNDWKISQLFAKADLRATSEHIYKKFGGALEHPLVEQIGKNIDRIHSAFVYLPQTIIPKASQLRNLETKVITTTEGATSNKIIHLTDSTDFPSMGFAAGTTPENFRVLAHVISPENKGFIKILDSAIQEGENGVFSTSYVARNNVANLTLFKEESKVSNSGIIFYVDSNNIAVAYPQDISSGRMKSVADVMSYLFVSKPEHESIYLRMLAEKANESSIFAKLKGDLQGVTRFEDIENDIKRENIKKLFKKRLKYRNYFASKVKESLNLSDADYTKLIREISQYKSVDGIKNNEVRKAVTDASDSLMDHRNAPGFDRQLFEYIWNEVVVYAPKPQAVFAKSCTPEEIPFELRKYAQERDLPIVIFGSDIGSK